MKPQFRAFETLTRCPVCGHGETARVLRPDVNRCAGCKTYFRSPRPVEREIVSAYDLGLTYAQWSREKDVRQILWQRRLDLVRRYCDGPILDVGTGDGEFLNVATRAGLSAIGTELSATGARIAVAGGHDVRLGRLEDLDFGSERFGAVTLWHVLEHVGSPHTLLPRINALLKDDGYLFAAVPNETWALFMARMGVRPMAKLAVGEEIHLTHFEPSSFKRVLANAGFKLVDFGVDDVDLERTTANWLFRNLNSWSSSLSGWHMSTAMYVVCRKRG